MEIAVTWNERRFRLCSLWLVGIPAEVLWWFMAPKKKTGGVQKKVISKKEESDIPKSMNSESNAEVIENGIIIEHCTS